MREKISSRERFRRFMLRLFKGVPYEDYEEAQEELREAHIEIVSLNKDLDEANRESRNLKEDIKRKDSSIAFFHRFGTRQPVKLQTEKTYSGGEYCDAVRRMCVLDDLAQGFLPAIKNYMWYRVNDACPEPMATAELWLYPLNDNTPKLKDEE